MLAGETDADSITLVDVRFETDHGVFWATCDDCFQQRALPFNLPFYGQGYSSAFVGSNGYITFDSGDSEYTENVGSFNNRKRISAFFDDLIRA